MGYYYTGMWIRETETTGALKMLYPLWVQIPPCRSGVWTKAKLAEARVSKALVLEGSNPSAPTILVLCSSEPVRFISSSALDWRRDRGQHPAGLDFWLLLLDSEDLAS